MTCDKLCVKRCLIHLEGLLDNYSSPITTVTLENGQLPTTRQEPELMFRNNGLLHHNVITAAGLLS